MIEGNCLGLCITKLLGLPEELDLTAGCQGCQLDTMQTELAKRGFAPVRVKCQEGDRETSVCIGAGGMYIAMCRCMDGDRHAVLCRDRSVIFDSASDDGGVTRVMWPEEYLFIVKLDTEKAKEGV